MKDSVTILVLFAVSVGLWIVLEPHTAGQTFRVFWEALVGP